MENGHKVWELAGMAELGGELCICHINNVMSGKEAARAHLKDKQHLIKLKLEWDDHVNMGLISDFRDGEVLEGLEPPSQLKVLKMCGNSGFMPPIWLQMHLLSNLVCICLYKCRNWIFLPPLGQLHFLEVLKIKGMDRVRQVGQEFYGCGTNKAFTSLQELSFKDMVNWEVWLGVQEGQLFSSLNRLCIINCPKPRELPPIFPALTDMEMRELGLNVPEAQGCDLLANWSSENLNSLSSLVICGCPNLISLFGGMLHHLTLLGRLEIKRCENLTSLNLQALSSLKYLRLEECPRLLTLSCDIPLFVEHLETDKIQLLQLLIPQKILSVRVLIIRSCPQLTLLTEQEGWENLIPLERLCILTCHNLKSLPKQLESTSSLSELDIQNCPQIHSLPEKGLPISLQYLRISGCPKLKELCSIGGLEWPKISHIPNLYIL